MLVRVRSEFDIALLIKFEGLVQAGNQPCSEGELRAGCVRWCERNLLCFSRILVREQGDEHTIWVGSTSTQATRPTEET